MTRLPANRITRKDWIGDAVLAVMAGAVCVVSVFLPWANSQTPSSFNWGLTHPDTVVGLLSTEWGWPILGLALFATALGAAMLIVGPRRLGIVLGLLVAAAGLGVVLVAMDATQSTYSVLTEAGLGAVLTLVAGVMLVPIGLAAAAVACVILYLKPRLMVAASTDLAAPATSDQPDPAATE